MMTTVLLHILFSILLSTIHVDSVKESMATTGKSSEISVMSRATYPMDANSERNAALYSISTVTSTRVSSIDTTWAGTSIDTPSAAASIDTSTTSISTDASFAAVSADTVYVFADQMPSPIGGMQAIYERMVYPDSAMQAGIEGRVVIEFIVNTQGEVIDPIIILGLGGGLNEVVIEGIKGVPFIPGTLRGEAVNVRTQFPVLFRLEPSPESIAQQNTEPEEPEVLDMTDSTIKTMPEPIGGIAAIYENVVYPQSARLGGYEGTVIIRFTIDKEGNVVNPEVIQGVGGGLDESAIHALTQTRFIPALRNGEPVAVSFTMPINFRLSPSSNSRPRRTRGN